MFNSIFTTAALLAVATLHSADAHSKMTLPKPNSDISNSPSGTIDGPNTLTVPTGMSFGYGPEENTEAFLKAWKAQTKYKTIREMVYDKFTPDGASTKECGFSAATGTPQALPEYVEYETGFDSTHMGPCEVWCDDERVFYDDNCAVTYPQKPAKLPYEKSKCAGAKRLQSIWLALHVPAWQAYLSCATLSGASASASSGSSSSGTTAPTATTATPTATTTAPSSDSEYSDSGSANSTPATTTPASTTSAPSTTSPPATTSSPSSSSSKCTPKRFRRD